MTAGTAITPAELRQLLDYNPETGVLTWKLRDRSWFPSNNSHAVWNSRWANKAAGGLCVNSGYVIVMVLGKSYPAHRVAWVLHHGVWPSGEVDHADMNRLNNRMVNLRVASHAQNQANGKAYRNNKSGFKGVYWEPKAGVYSVQIRADRKLTTVGRFRCLEEAVAAHATAHRERFGEFSRTEANR
jgi:HNH endonuclease